MLILKSMYRVIETFCYQNLLCKVPAFERPSASGAVHCQGVKY